MTALLIGWMLGLLSALVTLWLSQRFETRRIILARKDHPSQVVYDKQLEFIQTLTPVLTRMNIRLMTIDSWLSEDSAQGRAQAEKMIHNKDTASLDEFLQLIEQYYMFLPRKLMDKAQVLWVASMTLQYQLTREQIAACMQLLLSFQNYLRGFVGVDKLSLDFAEAFNTRAKSGPVKTHQRKPGIKK